MIAVAIFLNLIDTDEGGALALEGKITIVFILSVVASSFARRFSIFIIFIILIVELLKGGKHHI